MLTLVLLYVAHTPCAMWHAIDTHIACPIACLKLVERIAHTYSERQPN